MPSRILKMMTSQKWFFWNYGFHSFVRKNLKTVHLALWCINLDGSNRSLSPDEIKDKRLRCFGMFSKEVLFSLFQNFYYPEVAGFPLGTKDSPKFVVMETHYDNPELRSGNCFEFYIRSFLFLEFVELVTVPIIFNEGIFQDTMSLKWRTLHVVWFL